MSIFSDKNTKRQPVIKLEANQNIPIQDTAPIDNSKLWIDTSK